MKLRERILRSKKLSFVYSQYEDFQHGRGFLGKFTSLTTELNFAILVATFVFGVNLRDHIPESVMYTLLAMFIVYVMGKYYRRVKLLEVEQRAAANRSPIGKIQLEAAELIIEKFGKKKK